MPIGVAITIVFGLYLDKHGEKLSAHKIALKWGVTPDMSTPLSGSAGHSVT